MAMVSVAIIADFNDPARRAAAATAIEMARPML
jgi:hypothetical protein